MSPSVVHDLTGLGERLERMEKKWRTDHDVDTAEALAECRFRIALHPHTMGAEAVRLLLAAMSIDGANPRYAYHLARLFLLHGDLDAAARWLKAAVTCCPTSHRLWAHVIILQRELNERYRSQTQFEQDHLRTLAQETANDILDGKDHFSIDRLCFVPKRSRAAIEAEARGGGGGGDQESLVRAQSSASTSPAGPERGSPVRFTDAGKCRWTGVLDLDIQNLLEHTPNTRDRDRIIPMLQKALAWGDPGSGGLSRFAVLGIQWLLAGYSVATIRRLTAGIDVRPDDEAIRLLDFACRCFELPLEQVPAFLSEGLTRRQTPALLAALIHHRRLLWRSLEYEAGNQYRAARHMLNQSRTGGIDPASDEKATELLKKLLAEARRLDSTPPEPVEDSKETAEAVQDLTAEQAVSKLMLMEERCRSLQEVAAAGLSFLKEDLEPRAGAAAPAEGRAQACFDSRSFGSFINELIAAAGDGAAGVETLAEQVEHIPPDSLKAAMPSRKGDGAPDKNSDPFIKLLEQCRKSFNELKLPTSLRRIHLRIERLFKDSAGNLSSEGLAPSPKIQRLINSVRDRAFDETPAIAKEPAEPGLPEEGDRPKPSAVLSAEGLTGLGGLAKVLDMVDMEFYRVLKLELATFDAYTIEQRGEPELQMLQLGILNQAAETLYGMGKRREAREYWRNSRIIDPFCLPALKNIAVCDSVAGDDHSRSVESWRAYCEILYFHAIAGNDPWISARVRADFHAIFASAFAHGFVRDKLVDMLEDKTHANKFISLLNNPGALREFVQHRCAELMNRRFDIRTPTLFLGASRTAKQDYRAKMHKLMAAFQQSVCQTLPSRIAPGFTALCKRHLDRALEACSTAQVLTLARNPRYAEDEQCLIHWVESVYVLKVQFYFCFLFTQREADSEQNMEWKNQVNNLDFFPILDALNDLPLGSNEDLKASAVAAIARTIKQPAAKLAEKLDVFLDHPCLSLIAHVINKKDLHLLALFQDSFSRHPKFWQKQMAAGDEESVKAYAALDDGCFLYSEELIHLLKQTMSEEDARKALELLKPCHVRYPALTGPERVAATLLGRLQRQDEAEKLLEAAIRQGVYPEGVKECRELLRKLRGVPRMTECLQRKDFPGARDAVLAAMDRAPDDTDLVDQLMVVYQQWIKDKPADAVDLVEEIEANVAAAMERAFPASQQEELVEAGETRRQRCLTARRTVVATAAMGDAGGTGNADSRSRARSRLENVVARDQGNIAAVFYLAVCLFKSGMDTLRRVDGDRGRHDFEEAVHLAERVMAQSDDDNLKKQAQQIIDESGKVFQAL